MVKCGVCKRTDFKNKRGLGMHKKRTHGGYFTSAKEERSKTIEQALPGSKAVLSMCKDQAKKEWVEYRDLLKTRSDKYLKDIKMCLVQMKKGRTVIDIPKLMKEVGVNKDGEPKLAIARADLRTISFLKGNGGWGCYRSRHWAGYKEEVSLPTNTFPPWKKNDKGWIIREKIDAPVPIIPAPFVPKGKLENYYILWEVEKWEQVAPRDPILLKRLNNNMFAVLAVWDLTPLEQSIMMSR